MLRVRKNVLHPQKLRRKKREVLFSKMLLNVFKKRNNETVPELKGGWLR